jgi:cytidine deaminase
VGSSDELIEAARRARTTAYAPYSGYQVGAAMRDSAGAIFEGANVENISYGLTICAERVAASLLATRGTGSLVELAVATADGGTPCGMCLQTLLEFADDPASVRVHTVNEAGRVHTFTLRELLPHGFKSSGVPRVERAADEVVVDKEDQ